MLTLKAGEKAENLRAELQEWLKNNTPPKISPESDLPEFVSQGKIWQKKLSEQKFIAVHWPSEYGGRTMSLVEEAILQEELGKARAPQVVGLFGLTMVGPVLIRYGTGAQKERYLSKILSAEEIWCQGFSEPEAGSDLANLKTKATKVEGGFNITGQKIWTSFAHVADFIFVLARTSDEEKRHQGLTYFLIPMTAPGITVRPLRQITGDAEFNEVFFEDVFVPDESIVGQVGDGWNIAISTLMYERVILTFSRHIQSEIALRELLERKDSLDVTGKVALSNAIISQAATRALAYKHLNHYSVTGANPGAEGSLDKLLWSTSFLELSKLSAKSWGSSLALGESDSDAGDDVLRYFYSRGRAIAAGTTEVQKNIIAERLLGLKSK
jgi:alkylation response protein AidB-like acyl-CoA dehydrogenase